MRRTVDPRWTGTLTLTLGIVLSVATALWQQHRNHQEAQQRFEAVTQRVSTEVQDRVRAYEYGLRGLRGAVVAGGSTQVRRDQIRAYVASRDIDREFPGARGFGVIWRVAPQDEAAFVAAARQDESPDFTVRQLQPHDGARKIITFIEPIERNRQALGLDIASEPRRNEAAEASIATGQATLTAPLTLVQASGLKQRAFLLMLPIFRRGAMVDELSDRQSAVIGWTYAPLVIDEVLSGMDSRAGQYDLSLRDTADPEDDGFFLRSQWATDGGAWRPSSTSDFEIHGRHWQAVMHASPTFMASLRQTDPLVVGLGLTAVSTLLASLAFLLAQGSARTRRERLEQARRAAIVESSEDAIIGATLEGVVTEWNGGAQRLFGYTADEALGRTMVSLLLPPELIHEDARMLDDIARGRRVPPYETVRRHRDGSPIAVSLTASPILDAAGRCVGMAKTLRDTRETQRTRQALAELNAGLEQQVADRTERLDLALRDLRAILDAVPSMIGYWDRNLSNRVANRAYGEWFGLDPIDLKGRHLPEVFGQEYEDGLRPHVEAALRGEHQMFERSVVRPDGGVRHILCHYLPDVLEGEVRGFYVMAHDVSEITESRLQLAAAQRDNAALLQTLDRFAMVTVADRDGRFVSANQSLCRLTGYAEDELRGRSQLMLDQDGNDPALLADLARRLDAGQPWRGEMRSRAKDGAMHWLDTIVAPFFDADGVVEKYISIRTDISPIKRLQAEAEEARHQAEDAGRFLREVTDRLPLRIACLDAEGRFRFVNEVLCDGLGGARDDVLGRRLDELDPAVLPEFDRQRVEAVLRGEAQRFEIEQRTADAPLDREVQLVPDRDAQGRVIGFLFVSADVTERRRADRELRRVLALLRGVLDAATQVSIIAVDPAGRVNVFNSGAQRLLGYEPAEVVGRAMALDFHDPEELRSRTAASSARVGRALPPGSVVAAADTLGVAQEWTYRRRDGSGVPVSLVITAMHDDAGELVGYLGLAQDISARREHERSLQQAMHRANHANRAKSQFLANMSHEIRTPLNAVIGLSYLLERTRLDGEQTGFVGKIKVASKSLLSIINDVLDLSKIEAAEMQIERAPFSLPAMLREVGELMRVQAEAKGVGFVVETDDALPAAVEGDTTRLRQVLLNLLSNAIKFTERGEVRLRTEVLELLPDRARLRLSVRDSGIGIEADALQRLFQPFAQADTSTTRRYGGTGLGLSIVKQLVELMGGKVSVLSTPGEGSEFAVNLTLPLSDAGTVPGELPLEAATDAGPALPGVRVLVVDDSEINREVARRILELEGARVTLANNGQQAVEALLAAPGTVDLVLMDVQMPVLDGHDATRRIRSALGLTDLPVIALTAGVTTGEQERAASAGMNDVLGKPFDPRMLVACLRRHVTPDPAAVAAHEAAAAATPATATGEWPVIEGIDGADACKRMGGDLNLFHSMLKRLLRDFSDLDAADALEPGGLNRLAGRLHNLKGSAGTLGAKAVERHAGQAEQACRASDTERAGNLLALLAAQLQALARNAEPFIVEHDRDPASAAMPLDGDIDPREVAGLVEQLRNSDLSAMQRFAELAPDLRRHLGREAYGRLREQMDNLQFTDVAEALVAALQASTAHAAL